MDVPLTLIPMDGGGCHLMAHALINGLKANVLVDTGASRTVMDLSRARRFLKDIPIESYGKSFTGLGAEPLQTYVAHLPGFNLGGVNFPDFQVLLIDMLELQRSYAAHDLPRIDIVLGGDLLIRLGAVIDYSNKCLKIC